MNKSPLTKNYENQIVKVEKSDNVKDDMQNPIPPTFCPFEIRPELAIVFELMDKARIAGITYSDIHLPSIIIFGSQSSGKSSILQRLIQVPLFPVNSGLCTTCPIKLIVKNRPDVKLRIRITDCESKFTTEKKFEDYDHKVPAKINEIMKNKVKNSKVKFSDDPMVIEIIGEEIKVNLTLIDLPGMVGRIEKESWEPVARIVRRYISTETNSLFIHCRDVSTEKQKGLVDVEIEMFNDFISNGKGDAPKLERPNNMIGVMTKIDLNVKVDPKLKNTLENVKHELDTVGVDSIFYMVNTPDVEFVDQMAMEESFFKDSQIHQTLKTETHQIGIENLKQDMLKRYVKILREYLLEEELRQTGDVIPDFKDPEHYRMMKRCFEDVRSNIALGLQNNKCSDAHNKRVYDLLGKINSLSDQLMKFDHKIEHEKLVESLKTYGANFGKDSQFYPSGTHYDELLARFHDDVKKCVQDWVLDCWNLYEQVLTARIDTTREPRGFYTKLKCLFEDTMQNVLLENWKEMTNFFVDGLFIGKDYKYLTVAGENENKGSVKNPHDELVGVHKEASDIIEKATKVATRSKALIGECLAKLFLKAYWDDLSKPDLFLYDQILEQLHTLEEEFKENDDVRRNRRRLEGKIRNFKEIESYLQDAETELRKLVM